MKNDSENIDKTIFTQLKTNDYHNISSPKSISTND